MYYAEKQILKALPKMAKKADSDELRRAFEHHLKETEGQVGRLEQIFGLCGLKPSAKTCPAIKGILEEGEEDMKEAKEPVVLDASMIADAQAVEHYEIARYGTLIAWANQLGMSDAAGCSSRPSMRSITPTCSSPTSPRAGSIAKPHSCALRRPCLRMAVRAGSPALWLFAP